MSTRETPRITRTARDRPRAWNVQNLIVEGATVLGNGGAVLKQTRPRMPTLRHVPAPCPPPRRSDLIVSTPTIPVVVDTSLLAASDPENDIDTIARPPKLDQPKLDPERMERAMLEVLQAALRKTAPRTDPGAAIRWFFVGVCVGALAVYVIMASALHQRDLALATSRARAAEPVMTTSIAAPPPALTCPAPSQGAPASEQAPRIPTFDVEKLPKIEPARPRRRPAPKISTVDEDNPYASL